MKKNMDLQKEMLLTRGYIFSKEKPGKGSWQWGEQLSS